MSRYLVSMLAIAAVTGVSGAAVAQDRNQIRIVGSSTVFPFTQAVAEEYANATGSPAPVVESTGTGGGMKIFCEGVGTQHPDITGASRPMKQSEYEACKANGVDGITEVQIGFDGIAFAHNTEAPEFDVTRAQLFLALASEVPVDDTIVANPYTNWSEIDPSLPDQTITVFGPPPTSGTRDAWVELVMEAGCEQFETVEALDGDRRKQVCARMRTDGPFIEAGENDNLIVQRLEADPNAYGIFGFSFLYENQDKLKGASIDGIRPSVEAIADASYPVSRPLFFYIKNAHRGVIPGLEEFVTMYVDDEAIGPNGYLGERGLIPLDDERRAKVQEEVADSADMDRYGS